MIERASEFGASAAAPLVTGDASLQTAGDMLRAAREAHGIDVAVVAAALKVPVQKIEALEAGDMEGLPDPVFARALAASICRALRIDAKPVLEKLPGARQPGLSGANFRAKSATFRAAPARSSGGGAGSRILVVVVALLLIGAALMVWMPQAKLDQFSAAIDRALSRGGEAGAPAEASPAAETGAAQTTVAGSPSAIAPAAPVNAPAAASPAQQAPSGSATAAVGAMAAPNGATATSPAGSAPVAGATPATPPATGAAGAARPSPTAPAPATGGAAASSATASDSVLAFTARAETWVSVTDADGKQLLRRLVQPGENVGVAGTLPLAVVIGRASGVEVQVHGKPFDLAPITRSGGVARFEVKQ